MVLEPESMVSEPESMVVLWLLCQPQSKELGFGDFQTWSELLGQDLETVGMGDLDLDLGLKIVLIMVLSRLFVAFVAMVRDVNF